MASFATFDDVGNLATIGVGSSIPANMGFLQPNTSWVQPLGITEQPLSGTATAVQDAQTVASAGAETLSGSAAVAQAAQIVAAAGAEIFTGTAHPAQSAQTAAGSGAETIFGSGHPAQDAQTANGIGAEHITGSGSPAQAAQTAAASGAEIIAGAAAGVQDPQTTAATGTAVGVTISGPAATAQDAQTAAADGAVFMPVVGEGFTAGDKGVSIVLDFEGFVATGGTCTLFALPALPPGRNRVAFGTAVALSPVTIASNGLTATYVTTGSDFPSGGTWQFQARVRKPNEQAFMPKPRKFYVYPNL